METETEFETELKKNECEEVLLPVSESVMTNGANGAEENCFDDPINETERSTRGAKKRTKQPEILEMSYEELDNIAMEVEQLTKEEGEDPEEETQVERQPTQVPKKRKDAAALISNTGGKITANKKSTNTANIKKDQTKEDEQPTSSARAAANKENNVDENQCRVCTTKEDLVNIFKTVEKQTVAEMLMTICPTVAIARKDFMPQFICNTCLDNVTIAVQLKTQCENTERELRKKLSRSKNKVRRPAGYVVIDAPVESDPPSEEEQNDDVEFKVSSASPSGGDDSEDSDFSGKKRVTRASGGKRKKRKSSATSTAKSKAKDKKRAHLGRALVKRPPVRTSVEETVEAADSDVIASSANEDNEETEKTSSPKKKRTEKITTEKNCIYRCDECDSIFARKLSLVLHKKTHSGGREPINCEICGKQFKIPGAYRTHLEKHKDTNNSHNCTKCDKSFMNKAEMKRHLIDEHDEQEVVYQCTKCKRTFVTEIRLTRHQDGRCPGHEPKQKKNDFEGFAVGKDLFKSVAPLTTTYWSDSFSD